MTRYVSDTAAGKSISAYVILNKRGETVATVRMHHGNACLVNVFQHGKALERSEKAARLAGEKVPADGLGFQYSRASGYGYDKSTAALAGLWIDGHVMTDHCSRLGTPKPPKGRRYFPRDAKPKPGYSFANYGTVRKSDGKHIHSYVWTDAALAEIGLDSLARATDEQAEAVSKRADELSEAFYKSDDWESGYSDCYRESGLKYLEAIGYRVIQAI